MEYEVFEGGFEIVKYTETNVEIQFPYRKESRVHAYILFITNHSTLEQYMLYYKLTNKESLDNILIDLQNPGRYTYTIIYLHSKDTKGLYTAECVYDILYRYFSYGGLKHLSKGAWKKHLEDVVDFCKRVDQLYI
jgi:hypothetical protein